MYLTAEPFDFLCALLCVPDAAPTGPRSAVPPVAPAPLESKQMELAARLREAIASAHGIIEELPLSRSMLDGTLDRDAYLGLLGQLWHLHREIESALSVSPQLQHFFTAEMGRTTALANDLARLGGAPSAPAPTTLTLLTALRTLQRRAPWSLLGCLYVLEGSRMGSMVLVRPLAQALGVPPSPDCGLDYHLDGLNQRPRLWQQFKAKLIALPLTEAQAEEVIEGATTLMDGLVTLYTTFSPIGVS